MSEQTHDGDRITFVGATKLSVESNQPDRLILRDEIGQQWGITVRPDGQLQTAKWPDGEPLTTNDHAAQMLADTFESYQGVPADAARQRRRELTRQAFITSVKGVFADAQPRAGD